MTAVLLYVFIKVGMQILNYKLVNVLKLSELIGIS